MKQNIRVIFSVLWLVIGGVLVALAFAGIVDSFWNGMGSALLVVGVLQLLRFFRFCKNESYREKVEIAETDERNQFIRNKAWAWAGYLFILVSALGSIALKLFGQELLSMAAGAAVCLMLVLFWLSYLVLRKKY